MGKPQNLFIDSWMFPIWNGVHWIPFKQFSLGNGYLDGWKCNVTLGGPKYFQVRFFMWIQKRFLSFKMCPSLCNLVMKIQFPITVRVLHCKEHTTIFRQLKYQVFL